MKFNSFLAIAYAFVITTLQSLALGLPENLPMSPAALRAYVNNQAQFVSVGVSGTLVSDDETSYQSFEIEEGGGAKAILSTIAKADPDFKVVDPAALVDLKIRVYDHDWNRLYTYSSSKSVRSRKGGGYELTDPTYQLWLNNDIRIEVGEAVGYAELVYTNRWGGIDRTVKLDYDEGDSGFYISESQLAQGGAFLHIYLDESWDEYFYSPDGQFINPVDGEVHSLSGSIEGVTIVKGEWTQQVIQTYKGYGRNVTYEFHPSETDFYYLPIVTSEGYAPVTINVMYPNGEIQKFPAIVNGAAWNQIGLEGGKVYQIFFDWGDALIEDNGKG